MREAIKNRDYYRELVDTLIEDIKEISNAHESELATFRGELDWGEPAFPGADAKYVQLNPRLQVWRMSLRILLKGLLLWIILGMRRGSH